MRKLSFFVFVFFSSLYASFWTEWEENPNNPIFDPANTSQRAYYPCVSYSSNQFDNHGISAYYKMWFGTAISGTYGIALAYSNDGINWTEYNGSQLLSGLKTDANHPVVVYNANGFGGGSYYYKIWYWDSSVPLSTIGAIRYAESVDGITWVNDQAITQDATQKLVDGLGGYFQHLYGPGSVLYDPNATLGFKYIMYYDLGDGVTPTNDTERVGLAFSSNGLHWTRYGSVPVFIPSGVNTDWDGKNRFRASIIKVNSTYHMFYSGGDGISPPGTAYAKGIGHATSSDGINWTADPDNAVFSISYEFPWRNNRCYTPSILYDANSFSGHGDANPLKIWFTGSDGSNIAVGYAKNIAAELGSSSYHVYVERMWLKERFIAVISWTAGTTPPETTLIKFQIYRTNPGETKKLIAELSPITFSYKDLDAKENSSYEVIPVFS